MHRLKSSKKLRVLNSRKFERKMFQQVEDWMCKKHRAEIDFINDMLSGSLLDWRQTPSNIAGSADHE